MFLPHSKLLWVTLLLLLTNNIVAQSSFSYTGKIASITDSIGLPNIAIQILGENAITVTNNHGLFYFDSQSQSQTVKIISDNIDEMTLILDSEKENVIYIEDIKNIIIEEITNEDENLTSIDNSNKFLFYSTSNLYPLKFKSRGINYAERSLNVEGISLNNIFKKDYEFIQYQSIYNTTNTLINKTNKQPNKGFQQSSKNLEFTDFHFKQKVKSVNLSNNNFRTNASLYLNTYYPKQDISIVLHIKGSYQDKRIKAGEYLKKIFLTNIIKKTWNNHSSLSYLMTIPYSFYTPKEPITSEIHQLRHNKFYNPNWGWHNNKIKFAKENTSFSPFLLLSYKRDINKLTSIVSTVGYNIVKTRKSAISYFNTNNPYPTDYKNLPSYVISENLDPNQSLLQDWKENNTTITQINWNYLYDANQYADRPVIEDEKAALYYIGDRKSDLKQFSWSNRLNYKVNRKLTLNTGFNFQYSKERFYKTVSDLLGAPYVIDINKKASQIFHYNTLEIQNDIRYPFRKVHKDGIVEYDTYLKGLETSIWKSIEYCNSKLYSYISSEISFIQFRRDGKMQNGLYINNSLGKGKIHNALTYSINTKINYLLNNNLTLSSSIHIVNSLPKITNIYFNHFTNNRSFNNYKHQLDIGGDISLNKTYKNLDINISLFYNKRKNEIFKYNFFLETSQFDNQYWTHLLTNVSTTKYGLELDFTYKYKKQFKYFGALSLTNYYYSNYPTAIIIDETIPDAQIQQKVHWKNKKIGNVPLFTCVLGLDYKLYKWHITPTINFKDKSYIAISPARYLTKDTYINQENLGFSYIINLNIYRKFFIKKRKALQFHLKIMNLLNKTDSKVAAYEQHNSSPNQYYFLEGIKFITSLNYSI